ncbi:hypothetical protein Salat_2114100 [Sesamum alatum]|uniref:Uncharacterized protein n=1 Tax=Sesamum alatum TaxID=300844 RepID=A0AAE1Y0V7_9LAMI|nr:hypothetical protein Salat_2114100 [Sesamum alatum]
MAPLFVRATENLVADALSRRPDSPSSRFTAFTLNTPVLFDQLRDYFSSNPAGQSLLSAIAKKPGSALTFSPQSGLVYYGDRQGPSFRASNDTTHSAIGPKELEEGVDTKTERPRRCSLKPTRLLDYYCSQELKCWPNYM